MKAITKIMLGVSMLVINVIVIGDIHITSVLVFIYLTVGFESKAMMDHRKNRSTQKEEIGVFHYLI